MKQATFIRQPPAAAVAPSPAILSLAFRPFFLLGSAWAVVSIALWMAMLAGKLFLPSRFDPLAWHIHEMLFGWVLSAVAGFLLTAIANWTGRPPVRGVLLGGLVAVWILGRVACAFSLLMPLWLAAVADVAFAVLLCAVAWREVIAAGNKRNFPMPMPIALLGAANLAMYLKLTGMAMSDGLGWRLAMVAVAVLISVIGARIIPAFTRNWLTSHRIVTLPVSYRELDRTATATLHAGLLVWAFFPNVPAIGVLLLVAAVLNAWRLVCWRGVAALSEPLVAILHLGYVWLVVGTALLGVSQLGVAALQVAAIHALTAGAMGTMVLGVMTRVSLGHTGRPLHADKMTTAIYVAISAAAFCRIAAALASGPTLFLSLSAILWGLAFLLFLLRYGAWLVRPRIA